MSETDKQIHTRMLSRVSDDHDRTVGSFIYDATKPGAMEVEFLQKKIEAVEDEMDVDNLKGDKLSRFIFQRTGIIRKAATYATTHVVISGQPGASVDEGDLVGTDTNNYEVTETTVVGESGTVTVEVRSVLPGAVGNVPANTIIHFPMSINGLVDVYNPDEVTNGYERESDDELRKRYYDKLQRPGKAGNVYHYREWAQEVTGVGDVRIVPLWDGPLTVKVVVIDANKKPADEELIQKVTDHIEQERPFGAKVTVVAARELTINITVTILNHVNYETEDVTQAVIDNINKYLSEVAFHRHHVSYARIGSVIINTPGVMDYSELKLNNGVVNIPIENDQVALLGEFKAEYKNALEGGIRG